MSAITAEPAVISSRRDWWVRSRAWIGILIMVPFAAAAFLSPPPALEGTWWDVVFDFAGWICFMIGAGFRWWATLYIGGRKLDTMVTAGPYSACRNPLYVGTFLMGLGVGFFLQSFTFGAGFALAALFYLSVTVPAEETLLRKRFGQEFNDYCARVPRYWPRLLHVQSPAKIQISTRGLAAEAVRMARWLWLPVICEVIAHFRAESWWPQFFHLP